MAGVGFNELDDDALTLPIICYLLPFYEEHQPRITQQQSSQGAQTRLLRSPLTTPAAPRTPAHVPAQSLNHPPFAQREGPEVLPLVAWPIRAPSTSASKQDKRKPPHTLNSPWSPRIPHPLRLRVPTSLVLWGNAPQFKHWLLSKVSPRTPSPRPVGGLVPLNPKRLLHADRESRRRCHLWPLPHRLQPPHSFHSLSTREHNPVSLLLQ